MESTLLTNQYKTNPEGKFKKSTVKITGINIITLACIGSGGAGFNFCCNSILNPIKIGKT